MSDRGEEGEEDGENSGGAAAEGGAGAVAPPDGVPKASHARPTPKELQELTAAFAEAYGNPPAPERFRSRDKSVGLIYDALAGKLGWERKSVMSWFSNRKRAVKTADESAAKAAAKAVANPERGAAYHERQRKSAAKATSEAASGAPPKEKGGARAGSTMWCLPNSDEVDEARVIQKTREYLEERYVDPVTEERLVVKNGDFRKPGAQCAGLEQNGIRRVGFNKVMKEIGWPFKASRGARAGPRPDGSPPPGHVFKDLGPLSVFAQRPDIAALMSPDQLWPGLTARTLQVGRLSSVKVRFIGCDKLGHGPPPEVQWSNVYRFGVKEMKLKTFCETCRGKKVGPDNNLHAKYPEVARSFAAPAQNKGITPDQILPNDRRMFLWLCEKPVDPHPAYPCTPNNRVQGGQGCPQCAFNKYSIETSLGQMYPDVADLLIDQSERDKVCPMMIRRVYRSIF